MSSTPDESLTRWLIYNMVEPAYSPAGLAKFAIDEQATPLENWAKLRVTLGRLVNKISPESKVQYHVGTNLDAWSKTTWEKVLRLRLGKIAGNSGLSRSRKYEFIVYRLEEDTIYAPSSIASLIKDSDLKYYNEKFECAISLPHLKTRARITLASFRRSHITVSPSGKYRSNRQALIEGWYGKIWLSAFGFLEKNDLHQTGGDGIEE